MKPSSHGGLPSIASPSTRAPWLPWVGAGALALMLPTHVSAQQWTGALNESWNEAQNWSSGMVPSEMDILQWLTSGPHPTMTLDGSMSIAGIHWGAGATSALQLSSPLNAALTLNGSASEDLKLEAGSAGHQIGADLVLSGAQHWINESEQSFSATGDVKFGTSSFLLDGTGAGGWVWGSASSVLTNTNNSDLILRVENTQAATDLTLNGTFHITQSTTARLLRIAPSSGAVVNINAVLANGDGIDGTGVSGFVVGHVAGANGTVNLNTTKTYSGTTTINHGATLNVNAEINNGGVWDVDGGTLNWNVTNTDMAQLYLGGGAANSVSVVQIADQVTMNLRNSIIGEHGVAQGGNAYIRGGSLNLNDNRTIEVRPSSTTDEELRISSVIADGEKRSGVTKTRNGVLIFDGDNTYTGDTTLQQGTLVLDYQSKHGNKISESGNLILGGGNLILEGHATESVTQTVGKTTISGNGANLIDLRSNGSGALTLNLGAISRASNTGGTVHFKLASDETRLLSSSALKKGILGPWAITTTQAGDFFSTIVNGEVKALDTGYFTSQNSQFQNQLGQWQHGANLSDDGGWVGTRNDLGANTLRIAGAADLQVVDQINLTAGGLLIDAQATASGIYGGKLTTTQEADFYELKIFQNSAQAFEIGSNLQRYQSSAGGYLDITKSGAGELILSGTNYTGSRSNSLTAPSGSIKINEGTLSVRGGHAISDQSGILLEHRAGVVFKLLDDETIGNIQGGGSDGGTIDLGEHQLITQISGIVTYNGALEGSGTFVKQNLSPHGGVSQLQLNGIANTKFTGDVEVRGGLLHLVGNNVSHFSNARGITVHKNATLLFDGNGASSGFGNRLRNEASITLNGANGTYQNQQMLRGLMARHDQNGTREEIFGSLILNYGANYAGLEASNSGSSAAMVLTASGITRNHQSTFALRGTNLGANTGRRSAFRIQSAQEQAFRSQHLTGANGATGTSTMSIVRWAVGENLGNNTLIHQQNGVMLNLQLGNSLVTYINGQGLRALNFTNEYTTLAASNTSGQQNVRENLTANLSGVSTKNVQALVLNNSTTETLSLSGAADANLHLQSGTLLFTALQSNSTLALPGSSIASVASGAVAQGVNLDGFGGGITTGSGEYIIFQNNLAAAGVTIASDFTSAAKFTKSGIGTLTLTGNNTGLTDVSLNEGTLVVSNLESLGGTQGQLLFVGGTLKLGAGFTGDLSSKAIHVLGATELTGSNGGRMGVLDTNGQNVTFQHSLHGNGEFVKTGLGRLTLSGDGNSLHRGTFVVENAATGGNNANSAQLILNRSGGNAIGGNLHIGAYVEPTSQGSATVTHAQSHQIVDTAIVSFSGVNNKNGYWNLAGFDEKIAGLSDVSTAGVVQIYQDTAGLANSTLELGGSGDYFFNGYVRDGFSNSGGKLNLHHTGTGRQTFQGNNVYYTGDTENRAGTLIYRDTVRFSGNIENDAVVEFERADTSAWNYHGVLSGTGNFVKYGNSLASTVLHAQHTTTGTVTVKGGELTLGENGSFEQAKLLEVYAEASFKSLNPQTHLYGKVAGSGKLVGNFVLGRHTDGTQAELRPGASSQSYSTNHAGNLLGQLQIDGNVILQGGTNSGDQRGAQVTLQVAGATLNDAAGLAQALSNGQLPSYLDQQAQNDWSTQLGVDERSGITRHDRLSITGTLVWDAGSTIRVESLTDHQPAYGDVYHLFDWNNLTGTAELGTTLDQRVGGLLGDLYLPILGGTLFYDLSAFRSHGLIVVVPEPSKSLLLGLAATSLLWIRRRRPQA